MSHTCQAAVVRCMDFRLEPAIEKFLQERNLAGDADIISVAGAAKQLAEECESYLEKQIELSSKLHQIETLVLINHTDCGGYGGRQAFASREEERRRHVEDLQKAKECVLALNADLKVELLIADIQDDGSVKIEAVEPEAVTAA